MNLFVWSRAKLVVPCWKRHHEQACHIKYAPGAAVAAPPTRGLHQVHLMEVVQQQLLRHAAHTGAAVECCQLLLPSLGLGER